MTADAVRPDAESAGPRPRPSGGGDSAAGRDIILLVASRVCSRVGDGFLRVLINRYADASIQGRAKWTTSFGSRLFGLVAIGLVYFLVVTAKVSPRTLFGWLGVVPMVGGLVFLFGWMSERADWSRTGEVADES